MLIYLLKIVQIAWFDLLLSGDNAVLIAIACGNLPPKRRRMAIGLGATAAVVLRLFFALVALSLLSLPFVKVVAAVLLVWIAIRLTGEARARESIAPAANLWAAVRTIALADALMSLDNVLAITAAARGDLVLVGFGILLSIPFIVFGAALFLRLLDKFKWLVWAGAALLGWVAGEMAAGDPALDRFFRPDGRSELWIGGGCAAFVLAIARVKREWRRRKAIASTDKAELERRSDEAN